MLADVIRDNPKRSAGVAAVLLVAGFSLIWWNFIWQSPGAVWAGMLKANLSTTSVTKHQSTGSAAQNIDQYIRLQLNGTNASNWLVTVKQSTTASVTTESIGTPKANYVRYLAISTKEKSSTGKTFDFSSLTDTWGKSATTNTSLSGLFSQSLLDLGTAPMPPIGNVPADKRGTIIKYINKQQVFVPNFKTMKRETLNGRRVYVYDVSVKLAPYVLVMQAFAKELGLSDLDAADYTQYLQTKPVSMEFTVDSVSHQLTKVSYKAANYSETYSDWGLSSPIQVPAKTIPLDELQARLQKLE